MKGAFQMGKEALCLQSPNSKLVRSIHVGPDLPGCRQLFDTETSVALQ